MVEFKVESLNTPEFDLNMYCAAIDKIQELEAELAALRARCERMEKAIMEYAIPTIKNPKDYDRKMVVALIEKSLEVPK